MTLSVCLTLLAATPPPPLLLDRVAAIVDDHAITARALGERAAPRLAAAASAEDRSRILREALHELVDDFLIGRECARLKIETTDAEVDTVYAEVKERAGLAEPQFVEEIEKQGMTRAGYRAALRSQLLRLRWVSQRADRSGQPKDAGAFAGWQAEQERLLLEALRAKASVEVKL